MVLEGIDNWGQYSRHKARRKPIVVEAETLMQLKHGGRKVVVKKTSQNPIKPAVKTSHGTEPRAKEQGQCQTNIRQGVPQQEACQQNPSSNWQGISGVFTKTAEAKNSQ